MFSVTGLGTIQKEEVKELYPHLQRSFMTYLHSHKTQVWGIFRVHWPKFDVVQMRAESGFISVEV